MSTPLVQTLAVTLEFEAARVLPAVLIVSGAILLLWAIWRRPREAGWSAPKAKARADAQRVQAVMREAEELTGLLAGQMDRQAERLERLLREAEGKIKDLERLAARPRPASELEDKRVDPLNQQVYELADEGVPAVEIARQLSQHTGKVELILALRQR